MRRTMLLVATMILTLLVASGVALATAIRATLSSLGEFTERTW
jgi:hypothetical protein